MFLFCPSCILVTTLLPNSSLTIAVVLLFWFLNVEFLEGSRNVLNFRIWMYFLEKWTDYQQPLASLNQAPVTGMDIIYAQQIIEMKKCV